MLNILRSTYYQSKYQTESKWEHENQQLLERIKQIYFESTRLYSAIKVHPQLIKACPTINEISRLSFYYSKEISPYKQSKELILERENILEQDFSTTSINQK